MNETKFDQQMKHYLIFHTYWLPYKLIVYLLPHSSRPISTSCYDINFLLKSFKTPKCIVNNSRETSH